MGNYKKIYALDDLLHLSRHYILIVAGVLTLVPIGFDPFAGTKASVGGQDGQAAEEAFTKKSDRLDTRRDKADEQRAQGQDAKDVPSKK